MSTAKTKTGKSGAGKSVSSYVPPEPLPPVTPVPVGTDPSTLPFPEWSDQAVNAEKWDLPKTKDKGKQKPPAQTPKKSSSSTPAQFPTANISDEPTQYLDPHLVHLPRSLIVHEWKRSSEVFPGANFIMYKESSEYPDLISGSKHLLHSDFMRSFISAVGILEYLGNTHPSPVEFPSATFFPNTSDVPWRPWHHIYSMCKAGKGQKHNPQVNTLGKYVVRLYWLGCWRRITIDDLLPIDKTNHILLPSLDKPKEEKPADVTASAVAATVIKDSKGKKDTPKSPKQTSAQPEQKEIEMWPFLLCKALLKLSSLSCIEQTEILDFDIIHCLTGWIVQKIEVAGMEVGDIWSMCAGYSDHYTWPDPSKAIAKKGSKGKDSAKSKSSKSSKSGKASKVPNFLDEDEDLPLPFHLVVSCSDMKTVSEEEVPDIAPCWSHEFLVDQTRDIPLVKPDPLPELARWKRFRWLAWAIRKGLWPEPELIPIKCFKLVSVFKKCAEHVIYRPLSKEALEIKKSVEVIEKLALEMGDGKKTGKKGTDTKKDSSKANKTPKSSDKKGKKGDKAVAIPLPPDPSLWNDFNKLGRFINCLCIFFKPSQFATQVRITNISQTSKDDKGKADKAKKGKGKGDANAPKLILWNSDLSESRNEPIYLFADTIDFKLVIFSLAQVGNTKTLQNTSELSESDTALNAVPIVDSGFQVKKSHRTSCLLEYYGVRLTPELISKMMKHEMPFAYAVIENYNWQRNSVGNATAFLNTYGTKSLLIDVNPGRFVFRIWVRSDTPYFINLLSDTELVVGTLEDVLEYMSHEPERLMKMCHDISSSYGQLVQKFGTQEFTEGLVTFSKCYLPSCKLPKLQLIKVRDAFMKDFLHSVKESCTEQERYATIYALRVLFMNPSIKLEKYQSLKSKEHRENNDSVIPSCMSSDDVQQEKELERAAVTLQALFKKLYVRKLKALHDQSHKDYMKTFDALKKIYANIFGIQTRMVTCAALIRNFLLMNSEMSDLRNRYFLLDDLNSTIFLQHFTGDVTISPNEWVPVTRQIFYVNSPEPVLIKICLFCALPQFMVRVFNNDTHQEIKRFTNNSAVYAYDNNAQGYTVLCYGWSATYQNMPWKLDFVTLKKKRNNLIIASPIAIFHNILSQNYNPNVYNSVCRCMVNINHDTPATFRLTSSYKDVKLHFRCLNEAGQVFSECFGTGSVILPAVTLEFVPTILETPVPESVMSNRKISASSTKDKSKNRMRSGSLVRLPSSSSLKKRDRISERGSIGKRSSVVSIGSAKKKSRSLNFPSIISAKFKENVYILEGFVLEDSWPLTKDEWDVVTQLKAASLLGPPESISLSGSLKSKESVRRRSASLSGRKSSSSSKRKMSELKGTELPFWRLETVTNVEDSLQTAVDTTRRELINNIKRMWYESDPNRYFRSKKFRQDYLESHYIKFNDSSEPSVEQEESTLVPSERFSISNIERNSLQEGANNRNSRLCGTQQLLETVVEEVHEVVDSSTMSNSVEQFLLSISSTTSAEKNLRTLKKPESKTKILPPFSIEEYLKEHVEEKEIDITKNENEEMQVVIEDEEVDKTVKTSDDEEALKLLRLKAIDDFELEQIDFQEDMIKFLEAQVERFKLLDIFYAGCRKDSENMVSAAYNLRGGVIDMIIEAEKAKLPPETPISEEKGKKGKKKK